MTIHKGPTYTIVADGSTAEKSDGKDVRRMRFYPERDAGALAGEIDELTAWTILRDIAADSRTSVTPISPEHILISGDGFILAPWSESRDPRFTAPEGYDPVWALAASVFYIFLGTYPFQGLGGKAQTPSAPVPTLRRGLPELSAIISRALSHSSRLRPSVGEIVACADRNIERCRNERTEFPPLRQTESYVADSGDLDRIWPEKMQ